MFVLNTRKKQVTDPAPSNTIMLGNPGRGDLTRESSTSLGPARRHAGAKTDQKSKNLPAQSGIAGAGRPGNRSVGVMAVRTT